ncbi:MAG: NAD-dependent epimerase/dehydratase family protein [Anaerolineae bacterium]|nr:NAD-dependent epimerase/dehydratase family protein [Anaerolineae bacterium]
MVTTLGECTPRIAGARVLVTGGVGFIGSHLVDSLVQHGAAQVIVLDDLSRARAGWRDTLPPQVKFIEGSILDRDTLVSAISGVDVVYHLAAVATVMDAVRDPERAFAVNAQGAVNVALAACRAGVRRFVFASSREVYGDPPVLPVPESVPLSPKNIYGASKAAAEMVLPTLADQIEMVILRLANVYGPGDRGRVIPIFINNALAGRPLTLFGGQQVLDLVWIGDVVESFIKAGFSMEPIREPVNIGSGTITSLQALAECIAGLVDNRIAIEIAPPRGPEVERYQADLTRAGYYLGLQPNDSPLSHLSHVLEAVRAETTVRPHREGTS